MAAKEKSIKNLPAPENSRKAPQIVKRMMKVDETSMGTPKILRGSYTYDHDAIDIISPVGPGFGELRADKSVNEEGNDNRGHDPSRGPPGGFQN